MRRQALAEKGEIVMDCFPLIGASGTHDDVRIEHEAASSETNP